MKTKLYLAYGSNINVEQMGIRCPHAKIYGTSCLKNYELVFRGHHDAAVATIEPSRGGCIPVVIWSITPTDEKALDIYEGFPRLYIKQSFELQVNGKRCEVMAYVMTEGREYGVPSKTYRRTILDGYKHFEFDSTPIMEAIERERGRIGKRFNKDCTFSFAALTKLAEQQKIVPNGICPRCGLPRMKESVVSNALSRRADIYICDACGNEEALKDFLGLYDAVQDWSAVRDAMTAQ